METFMRPASMPDRPASVSGVISASVLLRQTEAFSRGKIDVVLGLSGGVDSGVAAALLQQDGLSVCGALLRVPGAPSAREDAMDVAQALDLPLVELDVKEAFARTVLRNFAQEYESGRTPNPCIVCNKNVKFAALCELADKLGAPHVATGHYAKVRNEAARAALLRHGSAKDQSYMLYRLEQATLRRLLLPLSQLDKPAVRALAGQWKLPVAQKRDSQDICFVPDGDHTAALAEIGVTPKPGRFVDESRRVLGRHAGVGRYTVGQRKGLGVAADRRLFVTEIDPRTGDVTLAGKEALLRRRLAVSDVVWTSIPAPGAPLRATVKLRLGAAEYPALVSPLDIAAKTVCLTFDQPVSMGAPGQSAVFYDGELVLGGGILEQAPRQ